MMEYRFICKLWKLSNIPGVPKKYTDFVDPSDKDKARINPK